MPLRHTECGTAVRVDQSKRTFIDAHDTSDIYYPIHCPVCNVNLGYIANVEYIPDLDERNDLEGRKPLGVHSKSYRLN